MNRKKHLMFRLLLLSEKKDGTGKAVASFFFQNRTLTSIVSNNLLDTILLGQSHLFSCNHTEIQLASQTIL